MKMLTKVAVAMLACAGIASADDKKPEAKKEPAKAEAPKPPAELDAMAKAMVGSWKCKGDMMDMAGGKSAVTATNVAKLDLNKFWLAESLEVKGGAGYKMTSYTTYDAKASKWRRIGIDGFGGYMVGTSDGMKDNKMDWNMDTVSAMGTGQFRDHVDASDAKVGMKVWGEMSMDKGKSWNKMYEMTCKK
ncbi:MAG: hypothetical protein ABI867_23390 [Kofleriaceae bacterium]